MMIWIRNERVLNWFGFFRRPGCIGMKVGMPLRKWFVIACKMMSLKDALILGMAIGIPLGIILAVVE